MAITKEQYMAQQTMQMVNAGIDEGIYWYNRSISSNDNYALTRNLSIAKQYANIGQSFIGSMALGFQYAGPVGAAAAAITTAVSYGIQRVNANVEEDAMVDTVNANLEFTRQRAGYSLVSQSMGENK